MLGRQLHLSLEQFLDRVVQIVVSVSLVPFDQQL